MKEEREHLLRTVISSIVKEGGSLPELLEIVHDAAVKSALVVHYGNQTQAAMQLQMHRNVLRRYMLGKIRRKGSQYERTVHGDAKKGCVKG